MWYLLVTQLSKPLGLPEFEFELERYCVWNFGVDSSSLNGTKRQNIEYE